MAKIKKKEAKAKPLTRKEQRKQKSEFKKQNKRLYFAGKTNGTQRVAAAAKALAAQSLLAKTKRKNGARSRK
ncbi:GD13683 [Drosophila simulans]|uniref:GD13683 n=1 Tax=Drosophila simulans TaxID=7240 RepID=B4QNH7_DROSI|nr:GD13683 [Drosophila simulans]